MIFRFDRKLDSKRIRIGNLPVDLECRSPDRAFIGRCDDLQFTRKTAQRLGLPIRSEPLPEPPRNLAPLNRGEAGVAAPSGTVAQDLFKAIRARLVVDIPQNS